VCQDDEPEQSPTTPLRRRKSNEVRALLGAQEVEGDAPVILVPALKALEGNENEMFPKLPRPGLGR
jgi:translation elongation factor EF-Tu-like GTPase